jgi:hypothetical protein
MGPLRAGRRDADWRRPRIAGVIDGYAALRHDLDFDPQLACRLADGVEAHLRNAAEADPAGPSPEAQQRTVTHFGFAREIAVQFVAEWQTSRSWMMLAAMVAVTFVAMRLRVM